MKDNQLIHAKTLGSSKRYKINSSIDFKPQMWWSRISFKKTYNPKLAKNELVETYFN
jgi:hypothetical protein